MDWKMGKKFFVVSSLTCFTFASSFVEAGTPACSNITTGNEFITTVDNINSDSCLPPMVVANDIVLSSSSAALTYVGEVSVESDSSGTARKVDGGGYSILSTVTDATTISLSPDMQLVNGSVSVGPGVFEFNDAQNWNTGSELTEIHITNTGTLQFSTMTGSQSMDVPVSLSRSTNVNVSEAGLKMSLIGDITDGTDPGELAKEGPGTLILTGVANDYSGGTDVKEGTLEVGDDYALGTGSLLLRGDTTFRLQSSISIDNNIVLFDASLVDVPSGTGELTGTIIGGGSFEKIGAGTLVLTEANSFSGGITIGAGTLELSDNDAAGTGAISFSDGTTLSLPVDGLDILNDMHLSGADTITVPTATSATLGGSLDGTGSLHKQGAGTLVLTGDNSYTDGTDLEQGTLEIDFDRALGTGALVMSDGTTFRLRDGVVAANDVQLLGAEEINVPSGTAGINGDISDSGSYIKTGLGTLVLNGSNSFAGTTTLSEGTLELGNNDALSTTNLIMDDKTTLHLKDGVSISNDIVLNGTDTIGTTSGNSTLNGVLEGTGSLRVSGGGTLNLSETATFSGFTDIVNSTLALTGNGSIESSESLTVESLGTFDISGISGDSTQVEDLSGNGSVVLGNKTLIVHSSDDSTFVGGIQGNGSVSKTGSDTLTLTGPNTYKGGTTVLEGVLKGNTQGLQGNIVDNTEVVFDLSADGTYPDVISGPGGVTKTGPSTLTITGVNLYTGLTNVEEGKIVLSGNGSLGTGSVGLAAGTGLSLDTTTNVTSPIVLGAGIPAPAISVSQGNLSEISAPISGPGGFSKEGAGKLILSGTNTYAGPTDAKEGTLIVAGSIISDVNVYPGATLKGCGSITGDVVAQGGATLAPGCSISTLHVNGSVTIDSNALFITEVGANAATQLIVSNAFTIEDGSTASFVLSPQFDSLGTIYHIVEAGDVTGRFTHATTEIFLVEPKVTYTPTEVNVSFQFVDLSTVLTSSNAIAVGNAIEAVTTSGNPELKSIIRSIFFLDTAAEVQAALDMMQPAQFKGLTISQENNAVKVQDTLSYRFQQDLNEVHCYQPKSARTTDPSTHEEKVACEKEKRTMHVWVDGFGDVLHQKSNNYAHSPQVGYQNKTAGVSMGIDGRFAEYCYLGALGAYTNSDISWSDSQGKGDIDTGYAGLYFSAIGDLFYANASVIGAWSHYKAHRNIVYPGINETASNTHGGSQLLTHLDTGLNFGIPGFTVRPFDAFDYITQTENGYTETGAGVYNLNTNKVNSIMLRNELGIQFAGCLCFGSSKWTISPKISWVREVRIKGATYKSEFVNTDVPFVVTGYFPDRSLVSPGVMVTGLMLKDLLALDLYYNGEFGNQYSDHSYGGQIRFGF